MKFIFYLYNITTEELYSVQVELVVDATGYDYNNLLYDVVDEVALRTGYQPDNFIEIESRVLGYSVLH